MICILSPAKIQNFTTPISVETHTHPQYLKEASSLMDMIRGLSMSELATLLKVNVNLAQLNVDRHFNWQLPFTVENSRQAVFAFNGEVFHGLDPRNFDKNQLDFLQSHLRILSGLYGVLRPLDLMQAYRLDVSDKLPTNSARNLYAFWGNKITESINQSFTQTNHKEKALLNLASGEYLKCIKQPQLKAKVINFEFLQSVDDGFKPVVVYIKKARGMMVRYVVENQIEHVADLRGFNSEGYWFNSQLSTPTKMVFTR
jgi:uncharacterized protein